MLLSKKSKIFDQSFIEFLESTSTFQLFEKKDESHSSTISDSIDSERSCYLNVLKAMFQDTLEQSMCWLAPNHGKVWMRAILPLFRLIELGNVPLWNILNLRMLLKTLTANDKYFFYKRETFPPSIQMQ